MTYLGTDAPDRRSQPDLRLFLPAASTWLVTLLLPAYGVATAVVTGIGLAGLTGALLSVRPRRLLATSSGAVVVVAVVCAATGALAVAGRLAALEGSPVPHLAAAERHVEMAVTVTLDPRPRSGTGPSGGEGHIIEARSVWVRDGGERVGTRVPVVILATGARWQRLVPSQRLRLTGRLVPAEEAGATAALVLTREPPREVTPPSAPHALAGAARARLRAACSVLPQPERGLVPALVIGDTSGITAPVAADFRETGMTHLLTVSGANLAIMTGCVLALAGWLRSPVWARVALGGLTVAVFVLLARPEPSVVRAAAMGTIGLLALALGRRRVGTAALSASVIGLLLFSPELARSYGFALSVLSTGGILLLGPRWRDRWSRWLPRPVAEACAIAVAAQLACAPVLAVLSAEVSLIAVPANILAGITVPVATVGGFLTAAIAMVALPVAQSLVWIPGAAVSWIGLVAGAGADVPHGGVPWPGTVAGALALAGLLLVLVLARGWPRRLVAVAVSAALLTAVGVESIAPAWPPGGWDLVMCDVGQGDALVLATARGEGVVVDTGVEPRRVDRCLRELGVDEVPLLVLTHDDADHVGGVSGVLRRRSVHAALAPAGFAAGETAGTLARERVALRVAEAGQRWRVGPWRLDVLWPDSASPAAATGANDASVVLRARSEARAAPSGAAVLRVLLTGDVEEPAQRALLGDTRVRDVDVLKTPHHGARTQEPAFLTAARPRVTLTSVGADNPHGHPAAATWRVLTSLTEHNYRTDIHGDIAVVATHDGPAVSHRRSPERRSRRRGHRSGALGDRVSVSAIAGTSRRASPWPRRRARPRPVPRTSRGRACSRGTPRVPGPRGPPLPRRRGMLEPFGRAAPRHPRADGARARPRREARTARARPLPAGQHHPALAWSTHAAVSDTARGSARR